VFLSLNISKSNSRLLIVKLWKEKKKLLRSCSRQKVHRVHRWS
jgi:hypothetical protein